MIQNILLILSSYLALFFSVIIFLKKNKHISDYYLAIWLIVLSAYIMLFLFLPAFEPVISTLGFIFLFLYIKSITSKSGSELKNLLFFVPSVLLLIPAFLNPDFFTTPLFNISKLIIFTASLTGSFLLLHRYKTYLKKNYANTDNADINWLHLLLYGCTFFFLTGILSRIFDFLPGKSIYTVTSFLFMNITGLKAIRQNTIFIKRPVENIEKGNEETYANYGLKTSDAEILAQKLRNYMETEKPYINQELGLKDLSAALNVYPHYITQVLNTIFMQNFYDYVNTYRVEQAKKQLKDPRTANLTILAIAFDCGFNSKSAFNRAFKQKTSQTPTAYRLSDTE